MDTRHDKLYFLEEVPTIVTEVFEVADGIVEVKTLRTEDSWIEAHSHKITKVKVPKGWYYTFCSPDEDQRE